MSTGGLGVRQSVVEATLTAPVYDVAIESPLECAGRLSREVGQPVWLKREDLQPTRSFKCRGAYHALASRCRQGPVPGVVASSAGNHAQGVALAARQLGVPAVVVMPRGASTTKVEAVEALGGEVLLHGATFDQAASRATELAAQLEYFLLHPFDNPEVIAGQGTVGLEICRQHPDPIEALFVPVGGGGLLAGVATLVRRLRPEVRIVGVEPDEADAMSRSWKAGRRVRLREVGAFADGVAVQEVGELCFELCRQSVDELLVVSSEEICQAMRDLFAETRVLMEPAGALALAGLKRWARSRVGRSTTSLVAITSGANLDFDRLGEVVARLGPASRRAAGVR